MQGILQQVTGGRFQDGLRNGLASSLSNELSRALGAEINRWARENNVDPYIVSQLRMVAQGFSSALVQTATNGGQAGIEAFLNDLINGQIGADGDRQRAEINELTAQYEAAVTANDYDTQATVLNDLVARWQNNNPTATDEEALAQVTAGLGWTVDANNFTRDANGRLVAVGSNAVTAAFDDDGNLMPGVVDTSKPISNQARQIEARLIQQGYSARDAGLIAEGWLVNRIADSIQAAKPGTSRADALSQVRAGSNDPNPIVVNVTTRSSVTGSEIGDQIFGALQGTGSVVADLINGVVDLAAMSRDGYAAIINLVVDDAFPDAATRNATREDTLNHVMANIDKLPAALVDGFNAELDRATALDATGNAADRVEAARLRSHAVGGVVLAALTLGESAVVMGGSAIRTLGEARNALGELMASRPVGLRALQGGSIDIAAMLGEGRVLVRNGTDFFVAEFRATAEGTGRQLVLLRPVTDLLDDSTRLQLRYAPESMAPENIAGINRAIDALTPQRFQQLTERYAQLVNSDKQWNWDRDFGIDLSDSQRSAIRRAAIEGGLVPNVPFLPNTRFADFNAVPGLVRNVETLPRNMWGIPEGQQYAYLDNLIGGRPAGYTWHHSQVPGRMELVPFGAHNMYGHTGGCSPGQWSFGSRK
jgi:hypothetical protein